MERKAVLTVSFGSSYLDTLEKTIVPIEREIAGRLAGYTPRRAFTSGVILRKLERRDGLHIDGVPQALERLAAEGFTHVVVQPTHIINGDEYEKLRAQAGPFAERFVSMAIGKPLLSTLEDYRAAAEALLAELPEQRADTALVFMGHGTEHCVNAAYCQLEYLLHDLGRRDILIGTVEGYPGLDEVRRRLKERPGVTRAALYPLMVVSGDHANNDLAGEDKGSWKSVLSADGYAVSCTLRGLGEYPGVRRLFAEHAAAAV